MLIFFQNLFSATYGLNFRTSFSAVNDNVQSLLTHEYCFDAHTVGTLLYTANLQLKHPVHRMISSYYTNF